MTRKDRQDRREERKDGRPLPKMGDMAENVSELTYEALVRLDKMTPEDIAAGKAWAMRMGEKLESIVDHAHDTVVAMDTNDDGRITTADIRWPRWLTAVWTWIKKYIPGR